MTVTIGLRSDGSVAGTEKVIQALPFKFGAGDDLVKAGPLKIGVDGGILYGTAYMRDPYGAQAAPLYGLTDPNSRGELQRPAEHVHNMIRTGHRLGWQMATHITGDAGVDLVLDAVEAANRDSPIKDRRFTLIHAYFPNAAAARRAAELGVCVDTQTAWYYKMATLVRGSGRRALKTSSACKYGGKQASTWHSTRTTCSASIRFARSIRTTRSSPCTPRSNANRNRTGCRPRAKGLLAEDALV